MKIPDLTKAAKALKMPIDHLDRGAVNTLVLTCSHEYFRSLSACYTIAGFVGGL